MVWLEQALRGALQRAKHHNEEECQQAEQFEVDQAVAQLSGYLYPALHNVLLWRSDTIERDRGLLNTARRPLGAGLLKTLCQEIWRSQDCALIWPSDD